MAAIRELAEGHTPWAVPVFVLAEFLRVVTHPRVYSPSSSTQEALAAVDALLASPTARVLSPGARFWPLLREEIEDGAAAGNLVFDAQIVAVCREHGVTAADGMTTSEILTDLPYLEAEDVGEALRFAAEVLRERELPLTRPA